METLKLEREHVGELKRIWKVCFGDSDAFIDSWFSNRFDKSYALGVIDGGVLAAAGYLVPYNVSVRGRSIPCRFLTALATLPEYRGRGLAGVFLKKAPAVIKGCGSHIAMLHSAVEPAFYEKYGWTITAGFKWYEPQAGQGIAEQLDWQKHLPGMNRCYHRYMAGYSGYTLRGEYEWRCKRADYEAEGHSGAVYMENGEVRGYMLFTTKPLEAYDFCFENSAASGALAAYAPGVKHRLPSQSGQLHMTLPVDLSKLANGLNAGKGDVRLRLPAGGVRLWSEGGVLRFEKCDEAKEQCSEAELLEYIMGVPTCRLYQRGDEYAKLLPPVTNFGMDLF
ncbi:MAG: GNAT family N-acetyltransferase [Christensenellales bacterium]|jgi:GNAT superfamily N-acetyltransferase